jgi:soluble lytic murein transglycosylase-like protein
MRGMGKIRSSVSALALLVAAFILATNSARAERIVLVDDGHGHLVYVNVEDPPAPTNNLRQAILRQPKAEIQKYVEQSAERHQVDPKLVQAVIQVESNYDARAVSNKGALGLMQLIPSTAQRFGVNDPFSARQNIEGGTNYLRYLLDLFDGDVSLSLAAYNSGENRVLRKGAVPEIPETVNYVRKVRSLYDPQGRLKRAAKDKPAAPVTIYKYVDAHGVVHYTDGSDL